MKKIWTSKIITILYLLSAQLVCAQDKILQLPELTTIHAKEDDAQLLKETIPRNGKIMLVFYDPGCGHCQELGTSVAENQDLLRHTAVYFITMYEPELVDGYINMFAPKLKGKRNITFWHDPGVEFIEKFNPKNYPATYIYNAKDKKLIKDFQGENDIHKMAAYLQQK